jgi:hypothetical protein
MVLLSHHSKPSAKTGTIAGKGMSDELSRSICSIFNEKALVLTCYDFGSLWRCFFSICDEKAETNCYNKFHLVFTVIKATPPTIVTFWWPEKL